MRLGNDDIDDERHVISVDVDAGVGEKIIGNVYIANDCKIGADVSVVIYYTDLSSVVVGVPARKLKRLLFSKPDSRNMYSQDFKQVHRRSNV